MSADASFLARWSRRKRSAATVARARPNTGGKGGEAGPACDSPAPFDPASLPSLDSIVANSDISAFLAANVPAELTRAALRRAWSADPAIRDFVGLSENSWDFNAPGGVPGFGSVSAADLEGLLARVMGTGDDAVPTLAAPLPDESGGAGRSAEPRLAQDHGAIEENGDAETGDAALRHESAEDETAPAPKRRSHGSALPE